MKNSKKSLWALGVLVSAVAIFFIHPQHSYAAVSIDDLNSNCLILAQSFTVGNSTSAQCDFFAPGANDNLSLQYGGGTVELQTFPSLIYQLPPTSPASNYTTQKGVSFPSTINILGSDGQAVVGLSAEQSTFSYYDFTQSTLNGIDSNDNGSYLDYAIYKPNDVSGGQFDLLIEPECTGSSFKGASCANGQPYTYLVVALVNEAVQNGNTLYAYKIDQAATPSNAAGQPCTASSTDPSCTTGTTPPAANSCESGYTGAGHEFNWIFCKFLEGIDGLTSSFLNIVEGQLDICTGSSLTDPSAPACSNNILTTKSSNGKGGVMQAWSIFRIIATSLLVIIMLVMVISQAIGGGPFDAYTIRKVLPRLVAAAIFMQISWYIFKFAINLVDDIGVGISQLMYYPFGGATNMSLQNLISSVGVLAPGFTVAALFTGLVVGYIASGLTIFGVLFLGAGVVISLIIGLLVLLFRQILVILLMISSPLALVAWILPGTQRYWKLWSDNFIKILFMFPLIMAMIAGGRIFAYVGSSKGILGLFIVLLGYFGPLWFLPKTFKWGGQAFGALSTGTINATKGIRGYPAKYTLAQAGHNREFRMNQRKIRLGENQSQHPRFDRLLVGGYNLALSRANREQRFDASRAGGREASEKEAQNALVGSDYERLDHPYKLDSLRNLAQGHFDQRTQLDGRNAALQRWALDQLATFGDWDIISNLRDNGQVDDRVWQMFVAKNISAIHQNAPHLSPQRTDLSQQGYEEYGGYKDVELAELRRQFVGIEGRAQIRDVNTGQLVDSPDGTAMRLRTYTKAQQALGDYQVRRRMSAAGIADLQGIVDDVAQGRVHIDMPTVQVTEASQTRAGQVFLPDNLGTPEAQQSITTAMMGSEGQRNTVAQRLVTRVIEADQSTPQGRADEANFRDYLNGLAAQGSPSALAIRAQLVSAFNDGEDNRLLQVDRQSVEANHSAADIARDLAIERRHMEDKRARMRIPRPAPRAGGPL